MVALAALQRLHLRLELSFSIFDMLQLLLDGAPHEADRLPSLNLPLLYQQGLTKTRPVLIMMANA
jgi:hypothetical protein